MPDSRSVAHGTPLTSWLVARTEVARDGRNETLRSVLQCAGGLTSQADADRMRPLPLWTAVTTVTYNMAVAVAAIASI